MTDRELMQQVLDALLLHAAMDELEEEAIELLRARLAQPEPPCKTGSQCIGGKCLQCVVDEPEPVAWMNHEGTGALCVAGGMDIPDWKHLFPTPLYVAPPKPVSIAYKSEPVAWARNLTDPQPHCVTNLKYCSVAQMDRGDHLKYIPLYTAQPQRQWVGLTDEEVQYMWGWTTPNDLMTGGFYFARAIEARLKEKNNG